MTRSRKKARRDHGAPRSSPPPEPDPTDTTPARGWMPWLALAFALVAALIYRQVVTQVDAPGTSGGSELDPELQRLIEQHARQVQGDSSATSHGQLGLVYEANDLWSEAARCFQLANELDPDDPNWSLHRGIVAAEQGDFAGALAHYEEAVAAGEDLAAARFRLADVLQRTGRLDEALEHFRAATGLQPESAEAHTGLGAALLEKKELEAAHASLSRAIALDPGYRSAHYQLGRVLRALGRKQEAVRELALGVDALKRYVPGPLEEQMRSLRVGYSTQLDGAVGMLRSGRAQEGIAVLEHLLTRRPNDTNVLNNLAAAHIDHGDPERALPLLEKARALDENEFATWINLASWALRVQRPEEALAHAQRAVALAANVGQAHLVQGRALLGLKRREEARAAFARAAELDARDPQVQLFLATVCVDLQRYDEAKTCLRTAVSLAPDALDPLILLGRLHGALGEYDEARAALDAANRIAPGNPTVRALEQLLESATSKQ